MNLIFNAIDLSVRLTADRQVLYRNEIRQYIVIVGVCKKRLFFERDIIFRGIRTTGMNDSFRIYSIVSEQPL